MCRIFFTILMAGWVAAGFTNPAQANTKMPDAILETAYLEKDVFQARMEEERERRKEREALQEKRMREQEEALERRRKEERERREEARKQEEQRLRSNAL